MRWRFGIVLATGLACAGSREGRPIGGSGDPPPSAAALQATGSDYDGAVRLGAAWTQHQGYQAQLAEGRASPRGEGWILRYQVVGHGRSATLLLEVNPVAGTVAELPSTPLQLEQTPGP